MRLARGEDVSYLELAAVHSAPFWARRQAKNVLCAWRIGPETLEVAELLVSELVTNAVQGSGCVAMPQAYSDLGRIERISLTLRLLPGRVVVEVFDNNQSPPVPAECDTDSESGRGLMLVEALSKEWGYFFPPSGGKTVFCVLGIPGLDERGNES